MPKQWTTLFLTTAMLLGVFVAGCTPDAGTTDGETETVAPVDPTEAAAGIGDDQATRAAAPEAPADDGQAKADPTASADASAPEPTMDATMEAFYQEFALPEKGEPDAPVVLYEFSDYT